MLSNQQIDEILENATQFLRDHQYFFNPDVVILCEVVRAMRHPSHNMIIVNLDPLEEEHHDFTEAP